MLQMGSFKREESGNVNDKLLEMEMVSNNQTDHNPTESDIRKI